MERGNSVTRVAVVQSPPVLLDRGRTIEKTVAFIGEAAKAGAALVAFPETYIPGYPAWIWRLKPDDMRLTADIHARLRANSIDLGNDDLGPVRDAAARNRVTVVLGINEIDSAFSGTTLFNTVVVIGADGAVLNRHRKLMPTNPERMVWGMGDGSGLRVVDTPAGRIGSLICWENYMPLARYALYAQDLEIYIAPTWDSGESWIASMRHIAKEAGVWVIGVSTALETSDVPDDFPQRDRLFEKGEWINDGDAVVVKPMGAIAAGPHHRKKDILYAEIDVEAARRARRSLDVTGHYSRPDVFSFSVDRRSLQPAKFID